MKIFRLAIPCTQLRDIAANTYAEAERLARRGEGMVLGTRFGVPLTPRRNLSPKAHLVVIMDGKEQWRALRPDDWPPTSAEKF